jgi:hypothetical protein
MPHPITGDCAADDDAASAAFTDRMRVIYARVFEIDEQQCSMTAERRKLLNEVRDSIGVTPGTVLATRRGRALVVRAEGHFVEDDLVMPGKPTRVNPAARCVMAPATKSGFHERTRFDVTHIDRDTEFMAENGKPLPA